RRLRRGDYAGADDDLRRIWHFFPGNLQFHLRYKTGGGPSEGLSYYYSGRSVGASILSWRYVDVPRSTSPALQPTRSNSRSAYRRLVCANPDRILTIPPRSWRSSAEIALAIH